MLYDPNTKSGSDRGYSNYNNNKKKFFYKNKKKISIAVKKTME